MELAKQEAADEPNALAQVVRQYRLCTSASRAGLRLAGMHLERGNSTDAISLLDDLADHPDLEHFITRWNRLQAAAGLFGHAESRMQTHREALLDAGNLDAVAQLDQWADQLQLLPD